MAQTHTRTSTETAIRRAAAYSLLADSFAYPEQEVVERLAEDGAMFGPLLQATPLAGLAARARLADRTVLEREHVTVFTLSTSTDCPTFETAYFPGEPQNQTARMADIAGFYRAFGVDATSGGFRPDELSVELEFMAYLCRKQMHAAEYMGSPRVNQVLRAQRLFLEEHLGQWAASLGERVTGRAAPGSFYQLAGLALSEWVRDDSVLMGAGAPAMAIEPHLDWARAGSHGPEYAGPARPVIAFDDIPEVG
jgi:TorA maturation chaperone TorD